MKSSAIALERIRTNFIHPDEHVVSNNPLPESVPGLLPLESIDKVFIARARGRKRMPFKTNVPIMSHYQLLNNTGQHIYTLGQANPKEKDKYFLMELFTVSGDLILQIVQRWNEPVKADDEDLAEILPYLTKDQKLPTIVIHKEGAVLKRNVTAYEIKKDDPDAHVHIRLANGDFLGHIWQGSDCWIIHDANLMPKYTFPKVSTNVDSSKYSQNARQKMECCGSDYSYYEYYHSHGLEATSSGEPVGFIETEIKIEKGKFLNVKTSRCSCAHFPVQLSPVDKVLVIAMTISQYCRASTSAEKAGCACFWLCIILSVIFCLASVIGIVVGVCIGLLDNSCRSIHIFNGSAPYSW